VVQDGVVVVVVVHRQVVMIMYPQGHWEAVHVQETKVMNVIQVLGQQNILKLTYIFQMKNVKQAVAYGLLRALLIASLRSVRIIIVWMR
jgi:hypothetical protein